MGALFVGGLNGLTGSRTLGTVVAVEPLGDITRIILGEPLPLNVDITPASTELLQLKPGATVWASVKATEVNLNPA